MGATGAILLGIGAIALWLLLRDEGQSRTPPIPRGTALDVGNLWEVETPLAVGQEIIEMTTSIINSSAQPVRFDEIRPILGEGMPENGELIGVFLVRFPFQAALHHAFPPVDRRAGRCVSATPIPVKGFVLPPGDEVMVATHFRATHLGTFGTEGRDIIYEQAGQTYRQRDPVLFTGDVRPRWKREDSLERRCRKHTTFLPAG